MIAALRSESHVINLYDELATIVQELRAEGVEYALCGALALAVHGAPRNADDGNERRRERTEQRTTTGTNGTVLDSCPVDDACRRGVSGRFPARKSVAPEPLLRAKRFDSSPKR